ncbi:MAG: phosphoribosylformylglycinamidine cyclo-ligase [Balneolales bacterium]
MAAKIHTYKDSGVDVKAGEKMVNSIKGLTQQTHTPQVLNQIGGFGGFFKADFKDFKEPVLVSSVDGVGTKLKVAFRMKKYDTVGQDLVNHCVNDIAVCGAEPLFFLDYFSTGKLEQDMAYDVVKGFSIACQQNGCALIGGETAEMPDIYAEGEFDLAGTIVGVVDQSNIYDGSKVKEGDILLGFPSTGLHTNGYSLARNVLFSHYEATDYVEELGETLGEALLKIHRSYLPLIRELKSFESIHGFAHITGGGIPGNTSRIIPEGFTINVDWDAWEQPPLFRLIQKLGNVPDDDLRESLNLGIGLVVVAEKQNLHEILDKAKNLNETVHVIGTVRKA